MVDLKKQLRGVLGFPVTPYRADMSLDLAALEKNVDAMARHSLYEAANVLLTTVKKRFALRGWGLRLLKTLGPKKARVAAARKLAVLLGRMREDGAHFEAAVGAA